MRAARKSKPYDSQKLDSDSSSSNKGPVAPVIIIGCPAINANNTPPAQVNTYTERQFQYTLSNQEWLDIF